MDQRPSGPEPDRLKDQLEGMYRRWVVHQRRGEKQAADKVIEEMIAIAPDSPMVLKVQGDQYISRGQRSKASECYKKAFELDPTDKEAETKFAESLIVGADLEAFVPSAFESQATGKTASILSALLPGLGQIVTGQTQKGIAFLAIYIVAVGALFAIPNGIKGIAGIFSSRSSDFNGVVLIPLLAAAVTWFISFADAQSYAKRFSAKKVVERPVPPVDKDFEI